MAMEHDKGSGADQMAASSAPDQQAPELASTGEPRVDVAISRLIELDDLPLSEHPAVYERVHEQLVEVLGELHAGQGPAGGGGTDDEHA